jgi:hypothetical protein
MIKISFIFGSVFGVAMKLFHCNEKGMRLESATVPAAVMPDPALTRDEGFLNTCHCDARRHGKAQKTGISQKTCQII